MQARELGRVWHSECTEKRKKGIETRKKKQKKKRKNRKHLRPPIMEARELGRVWHSKAAVGFQDYGDTIPFFGLFVCVCVRAGLGRTSQCRK